MAETFASTREPRPDVITQTVPRYVQWGPIFAGALAAAGVAFVLHSFALGIGLAVSSTAPTWRDSSAGLWFGSGVYLLFVAVLSYGVGGYVAGRTRERVDSAGPGETETRDGFHGLIAWAMATLATGVLLAFAAPVAARLAAPSAGSAGPTASVGGENILAYDLDRLFRAERQPGGVDMNYARAEASRILLTSTGHDGVAADDRTYLARLTGEMTGLTPADAARRVDTVIASSRRDIDLARHASLIVAFFAGAAAAVGLAVAWFAAGAGGRQRDGDVAAWGTVRGVVRREAAR
ncbi:MAG TPA: hypothetical protein VMH36_26790 [Alphaproteobacteria bacterium]|nr:hypothetical protein [Alphaproteobacteria bacterium]